MDFIPVTLWSLLLSVFIYYLALTRKRRDKRKLPPGPSPLPLVGNLFQLGVKPNESLAELAKTYGPIMTLRLGQILTVVVSSPVMAKEVLQINDQSLAGRLVGDSVRALDYDKFTIGWLPAAAEWRRLRMLCNTQMFSAQKLNANESIRRRKVQELIAYMRKRGVAGEAVDMGLAASITMLNLLSNIMLSADLTDINSGSAEQLKHNVHAIMDEAAKRNVADYFPILKLIDPQGAKRRMAAHFKKLHVIFDKFIDERLKARAFSNTPRQNDFLDVLLDQTQDNESEFGRLQIKTLLTELFTAGTHTTTVTIEWAMAELLSNPNVMEKARSEIMETIGLEHEVAESDIARLPYLQAIIKESLRLHPTASLLLPHKAEASVTIGSYTIPKHAQVLINAWAIGRDPQSWENPNSFQPERFMGSSVDLKGQDYELIPFGAGRRICPGMPFALRVVPLILASVLQAFSLKLSDGVAPVDVNNYKFGLNIQIASPLLVVPLQE